MPRQGSRNRLEPGELRKRGTGELTSAREHSSVDAHGSAPESAALPGATGPKKRQRCDKEGDVIFLKPGALDGWEGVSSQATALVVVQKKMGPPRPGPDGSPRYVIARPLLGGPQEEWHISQIDSIRDRLPDIYRAFTETADPEREDLRALIASATRKQHERAAVPISVLFGQIVPGADWSAFADASD